jgi:hypothetical protein
MTILKIQNFLPRILHVRPAGFFLIATEDGFTGLQDGFTKRLIDFVFKYISLLN